MTGEMSEYEDDIFSLVRLVTESDKNVRCGVVWPGLGWARTGCGLHSPLEMQHF